MRIFIIVVSLFLWLWFLGCTTTWKFGKVLLVEGMGVKSIEFVALILFTLSFGSFILFEAVGKWILIAWLSLWLIEQFFCHWYFTIFGASERKLRGYNECFKGTVKLFPMSEKRLVPDLYHTVLHFLIIIDLVFVAIY